VAEGDKLRSIARIVDTHDDDDSPTEEPATDTPAS